MRDLVDVHYVHADLILMAMDNVSTHTAGALYETFPVHEAHRVRQRLEFHSTPKNARRVNMVLRITWGGQKPHVTPGAVGALR